MATRVNPTPPGTPHGRDETVAALVRAAGEVLASSPPAEVSLRDLAKRAGVTYSLVNRHVGTKEALFARVLIDQARAADRIVGRHEAFGDGAAALFDSASAAAPGAYVRLLAWLLLSGADPVELQVEFPTIERLRRLRLDDGAARRDAGADAALVVALVMGWNLFGHHLAASLGTDPADLDAAVGERLRRVVSALTA